MPARVGYKTNGRGGLGCAVEPLAGAPISFVRQRRAKFYLDTAVAAFQSQYLHCRATHNMAVSPSKIPELTCYGQGPLLTHNSRLNVDDPLPRVVFVLTSFPSLSHAFFAVNRSIVTNAAKITSVLFCSWEAI